MPLLPLDKAMLIVCRTINPFVTIDVLVDDTTVTPEAPSTRIADFFFNLDQRDKKFGSSTVNDILRRLVEDCHKEGYDVLLGRGQLIKGVYKTVRALAMALRANSEPIAKADEN